MKETEDDTKTCKDILWMERLILLKYVLPKQFTDLMQSYSNTEHYSQNFKTNQP